MCPLCDTTSAWTLGNRRNINCKFGFHSSNICICFLHMRQRITEYLLKKIANSSNTNKVQTEKFLKELFGISINFTEQHVSSIEQISTYNLMLTGDMVHKVLVNRNKLMEIINENEFETGIWNRWYSIYQNLSKFEINKDQLYTDCDRFFELCKYLYAQNRFISWYIHILKYHIMEYIDNFGSLKELELQGFESANKQHQNIQEQITPKGVRKKRDKESYKKILGEKREWLNFNRD